MWMASRDCDTSIIMSLKIKWLASAQFIYMCSLSNCTTFSLVSHGFYTHLLCLVLNKMATTVTVCFYSNQHTQGPGPWLLLQYKFDVVIAPRKTEVGKNPNHQQQNSHWMSPMQSFPLCFSRCLMQHREKSTHHHISFNLFAQASLLTSPPSPWPSSFWTDSPVKSLHWILQLSTTKPCFLPETSSASFHLSCKRSERFPNITQACSYLPAQRPFELYLARSPFVSWQANRPSSLSLFNLLSPSFQNLCRLLLLTAIILLSFLFSIFSFFLQWISKLQFFFVLLLPFWRLLIVRLCS